MQKARVLQKPGGNVKGQETEQVQSQEESMEDPRQLRCLSIHILFIKNMVRGWVTSAYKYWVVIDSK